MIFSFGKIRPCIFISVTGVAPLDGICCVQTLIKLIRPKTKRQMLSVTAYLFRTLRFQSSTLLSIVLSDDLTRNEDAESRLEGAIC